VFLNLSGTRYAFGVKTAIATINSKAKNAILTAAGHNLHLLEKWRRLLFVLFLAAFIQIHIRQSIRTIKHTPA
jgi:hypothetical protein